MSVTVIINPVSGGARPGAAVGRARLAAAILEQHREVADVVVTERHGHARELAIAAVHRGARLVIAWGGDGTINEIASALAFGEVPLGIIAAGSGNGLARELGIKSEPERALVSAITAPPMAMDLGEIGGRLFANIAGIGLDAHVAGQFNDARNVGRGFIGYLSMGAKALVSYVPETYTIVTDQAPPISSRAVVVVVANSAQYGNNARIAPGARVDDGVLDLVVLEERSRLWTVCQTPRLFTGSVSRVRGCTMRKLREATINSSKAMMFHVDGEPVQGGTTLTARVHPGALKVCGTDALRKPHG